MGGELARPASRPTFDVPEKIFTGDATVTLAVTVAVTPVGRDVAMTPTSRNEHPPGPVGRGSTAAVEPSPFREVSSLLARRSRGKEGREAIGRFAAAAVPVGESADPYVLALACRPGGDPEYMASVVRALSVLVPGDEMAGLCLVVTLLPALLPMAMWLRHHGSARSDAEATAIAALWEAACPAGSRDARCLLRVAWNKVRGELRVELRHRRALVPSSRLEVAALSADLAECLEVLLSDATDAGAIRADQAELLRRLYVEDVPAWLVATATGRSVRAVSNARRRAERALGRFLTGGGEER